MEYKTILENKNGLHARPAAKLVKVANKFSSNISIILNGKEVNAKSILSLMQLGASQGSEIIIKVVGEDEEKAMTEIKKFIKEDLVEE